VYDARTGTPADFTRGIDIVFAVAGAIVLLALVITARLRVKDPDPQTTETRRDEASSRVSV